MSKVKLSDLLKTDYLTSTWRWSLVLILIVVVLLALDRRPMSRTYITSDGHAYYGHLPALFIYQDKHFGFLDNLIGSGIPHTYNIDDFRRQVDGGVVNIAYAGVALLWIPAFLIAHVIAVIGPAEANGYATPYQLSILLSAIIYLMIGLWAFGRLLENLKIKPLIISGCLIIMVFTTSILYYTVDEPAFTHIYTMSLFGVFMLYMQRFLQTYRTKHLWIWMMTLAILGLIRPTNAVMVLAIPMLAGSSKALLSFIKWIFTNPLKILPPAVVFVMILAIQPLIYFIQTGSFFVWSYQGVSFNFATPQFLNVLFSYEKGLFIYTPILIFSLIGFGVLLRTGKYFLFWLFLSIAVSTYVIASWWNWWYGMSFGHRAFIDYYPLFFIAIAIGLNHMKNKLFLHFFIFISLVCIGWNQMQLKQYRSYIFYWKMDKDMFWRVFLHTSRPYKGLFWEDEKFENTLSRFNDAFPVQKAIFRSDYESAEERRDITAARGIAHTGIFSARLEPGQEYGALLRTEIADELTNQTLAMLGYVFIRPLNDPTRKEIFVVLEVWRDGQVVHSFQSSSRTYNQFAHQWNRLYIIQTEGYTFQAGDSVFVYLYNPYQNTVYWDDFTFGLYGKE